MFLLRLLHFLLYRVKNCHLHSNMFLLRQYIRPGGDKSLLHLHSNMFLLRLNEVVAMGFNRADLHSNMFLLRRHRDNHKAN